MLSGASPQPCALPRGARLDLLLLGVAARLLFRELVGHDLGLRRLLLLLDQRLRSIAACSSRRFSSSTFSRCWRTKSALRAISSSFCCFCCSTAARAASISAALRSRSARSRSSLAISTFARFGRFAVGGTGCVECDRCATCDRCDRCDGCNRCNRCDRCGGGCVVHNRARRARR